MLQREEGVEVVDSDPWKIVNYTERGLVKMNNRRSLDPTCRGDLIISYKIFHETRTMKI